MKLFALIAAFTLVTASLYADDFETCVQNALQSKQYENGVQCLRSAEQSSPKSYRIAYLFGVVFNAAQQPDSAIAHLKRAVDLKNDYAVAYQELGNAYFQKKNYISAILAFANAVKNEHANPTYANMYNLGLSYALADSFKQGTFYLTKASELDASKPEPHESLGDLYSRHDVNVLAKEEYETTLRLDPKSVSVRNKLAMSLYKNGDVDTAEMEFKSLIASNPNDTASLQNLASIYLEQKNKKDARNIYKQLEQLDPSNFNYVWNDAVLAFQMGEYKDAVQPLKRVTELRNDSSGIKAYQLLGQCQVYAKDFTGAAATYRQFMQKDSAAFTPNDLKFYGSALLSSGDTAGAFSVFESYCLHDTTDCQITKLIGPQKMREKKFDDAISFFQLRLKRCADASSLSTYKNIGLCYAFLNKPDSAILWYRKVLEKSSNDSYSLLNIARTQYQGNEQDSAFASYQAYIEHAPNDTSASKQEIDNGMEESFKMTGVTLLVKKEYENALEDLKKALAINKDDCDALLWTAQAYHNLQQKDDAIKYYNEVVKHDCKNAKDAQKGLKMLQEN